MSETETPQIYLITPSDAQPGALAPRVAPILESLPVACLRLATPSRDEGTIIRLADELRDLAHASDVPVVIEDHMHLAQKLGLDGVHLNDGARSVRKARKLLGNDAIIGAQCGTSRHAGLSAGEAGADYVSFGPCGTSVLGDGSTAPKALFEWWSEMIEIPVVAEGNMDEEITASYSPVTDFFAFGSEVWAAGDPLTQLEKLRAAFER